MLAGFTMDSAIGVRDRNSVGGDPFSVQIKVTDGTTTYSDTQNFTMASGSAYETVTSQLIVPENTLAYSLATFGLIMIGDSLDADIKGALNAGMSAIHCNFENNIVNDNKIISINSLLEIKQYL